MKKIILLFLFLSSMIYSYQIVDEIGLLKKEDKETLEKRIENIKKDYNLNFDIFIYEEGKEEENNLNKQKKSVIIKLEKLKANNKIKVKIEISKDVDLSSYEEDIKSLMDNVEVLANNENYLDMFYELTGNISDIINLIELEKEEQNKEKRNKNMKSVTVLSVLGALFLLGIIYLIFITKDRSHMCKDCNVEMDLIESLEEDKKVIKIYTCKICGYTRKITSIRH